MTGVSWVDRLADAWRVHDAAPAAAADNLHRAEFDLVRAEVVGASDLLLMAAVASDLAATYAEAGDIERAALARVGAGFAFRRLAEHLGADIEPLRRYIVSG